MAEDIPGMNDGISTERTLSEVVNELKRVNENEELSREVSINSQLAMEKLRDASTDQSTRAALIISSSTDLKPARNKAIIKPDACHTPARTTV